MTTLPAPRQPAPLPAWIDPEKLERAQRLLGARNPRETLDLALELLLAQADALEFASAERDGPALTPDDEAWWWE